MRFTVDVLIQVPEVLETFSTLVTDRSSPPQYRSYRWSIPFSGPSTKVSTLVNTCFLWYSSASSNKRHYSRWWAALVIYYFIYWRVSRSSGTVPVINDILIIFLSAMFSSGSAVIPQNGILKALVLKTRRCQICNHCLFILILIGTYLNYSSISHRLVVLHILHTVVRPKLII